MKYKLPRLKLCLVPEGKSIETAPVIQSSEQAAIFLTPLKYSAEEHFVALHLNTRHQVIGFHEVSHGTLSESLVHPREVFKAALLNNSYALLVGHNHPSGSVISPSREDIETTKQLIAAGNLLGIAVIDHLIVGPSEKTYSFRNNHPDLWSRA